MYVHQRGQEAIITSLLNSLGFTLVDGCALAFFLLAWMTHTWIINSSPFTRHTISHKMRVFRHHWMRNMVSRETKMVDALIQNSLQYGVLFFASTSILVIGALMAGLGASDQAVALLGELPFAAQTSRAAWEIKVLLVVFIFTFAFFKFAWSYRLFNYVMIMLGAAPDRLAAADAHDDPGRLEQYADKVARLHTLGARHFTTGLNAYFFAMAAIAWFLNAWLFITATVLISMVLYRRAFRSNFMKILDDLIAEQ